VVVHLHGIMACFMIVNAIAWNDAWTSGLIRLKMCARTMQKRCIF
jgi:hypothetical protein